MSLISKKQFAELSGLPTNALAVYIKRGKVVAINDQIDTADEINQAFLEKRKGKHPELAANTPQISSKTAAQKNTDRKPDKISPVSDSQLPETTPNDSYQQLEKKLKHLDTLKRAEEIELLRKKNEKMEGEMLPTDVVKSAFSLHFKSVTSSFKNSIDKMLMEWSKKKDFTRDEVAAIRGNMIKELNAAVEHSVRDSKKNITNLIAEYSVKKGIGEHG